MIIMIMIGLFIIGVSIWPNLAYNDIQYFRATRRPLQLIICIFEYYFEYFLTISKYVKCIYNGTRKKSDLVVKPPC